MAHYWKQHELPNLCARNLWQLSGWAAHACATSAVNAHRSYAPSGSKQNFGSSAIPFKNPVACKLALPITFGTRRKGCSLRMAERFLGMENSSSEDVSISVEQMTVWAENTLHINHLHTLVQRELEGQGVKYERARNLSERARVRAWKMLTHISQIKMDVE